MANLTDTQKDEGNDSLVSFVMAKTIYKDPWGRLVPYIFLTCVIRKLFLPLINVLMNEPPVRRGGIANGSSARG